MKKTFENAVKSVAHDSIRQIQEVCGSRQQQHERLSAMAGLVPEGGILPPHICRHCGGDTMKPCPFQHPSCPLTKENDYD